MSDHIQELERRLDAGETWEKKRVTIPTDLSAPTCGTGNPTHYGNRRFSGSRGVSLTQGMLPSEVPLARKLMPQSAQHIRDDGRVVFPDSKAEQVYRKEFGRVRPNPSLD